MINVLISKSKRKLRNDSSLVGIQLTNGGRNLKEEERENSMRRRASISEGATNIKENIITTQALKNVDFLGKQLIVL